MTPDTLRQALRELSELPNLSSPARSLWNAGGEIRQFLQEFST